MEDDSREMLQILKQASSADVEKGRDVKKQLVSTSHVTRPPLRRFVNLVNVIADRLLLVQQALWDTLLEARIRIQKCVTSANVLPAVSLLVPCAKSKQRDADLDTRTCHSFKQPRILGDYVAQSEEAASGTTEALEELSELLFTLREGLHRTNDKLTMPDSGESRKRKRGSTDYLDAALEDLANLSSIVLEHERSVITKWSDKISSASMNAGQQNKFKAIGAQNTLAQIEQTLAQDMARLVERTKVRRGTGGKVVKVVGRVGLGLSRQRMVFFRAPFSSIVTMLMTHYPLQDKAREPVQGEKDIDQEVFDDADFYQALLREVVDATSTGNAGVLNGTPSAYAQFNQVSRKKAAGVDPKASKGRRLRFHVHETLQNFMAPVPMQTWEKEQIDELFRGLLGGNHAVQEEAAEEILQDDEYGIGATGEGAIRIF